MIHNADVFTDLYNRPFVNGCTSESHMIDQPSSIRVSLRAHQRAIIYQMNSLETSLQKGLDISGETLFSRYAILGDSVGVGKSLMVLGHIASKLNSVPPVSYKSLNNESKPNLYSLKTTVYSDLSNSPALLVVPHTLFRQWEDYITKQTTLEAFFIRTKRSLNSKTLLKKIMESDFVLVSNTLLGKLLEEVHTKVYFSRIYMDEADSIYVPSTHTFPQGNFVWFISATWPNLVFENERVWLSNAHVQRIMLRPEFAQYDPSFQAQFAEAIVTGRGYFSRYASRSGLYLRDYLRNHHPFRSHVVLKCRDSFIQESISLPPLFTETILCEPTVAQRILSSAIPANIQNLLNAGDITSALTALGVPSDSPMNLIQAVTEHRQKELKRLERLYIFKSEEEYASPQVKEQALANLQGKINGLKEQIESIKQRIENYKKEICAICFDEPNDAVLTPCCSRIFCGGCILMSLSRIQGCPMCRSPIQVAALQGVSEKVAVPRAVAPAASTPPKKIDALLNLIRSKPNDRFLVFSRYENPFRMMQETLEAERITVETVKGNKDVINSVLHKFESGESRVLLLNSNHAGAGLNITSATYVVLWHAMTTEEEKQILGRAYRMGRTTPLNFVKLVHPDEVRS